MYTMNLMEIYCDSMCRFILTCMYTHTVTHTYTCAHMNPLAHSLTHSLTQRNKYMCDLAVCGSK